MLIFVNWFKQEYLFPEIACSASLLAAIARITTFYLIGLVVLFELTSTNQTLMAVFKLEWVFTDFMETSKMSLSMD